MKFFGHVLTSIALISTAVCSWHQGKVLAFTITQNNNFSQLLTNLLGDTTGLSNFSINLVGDGRAYGTFTDDPFNLGSAVAMSTGKVVDLAGVNQIDRSGQDLSTDFGLPGSIGDSISMQVSFDNSSADNLYFQYVFGSEEFVEFGGSSFNDSFSLALNGINRAKLSDGKTVTINNIATTPLGPFHPDFINNRAGTGPASAITRMDGYTKPLLFEAPLLKNRRNTLVINVQDISDGIYDSAIFIKGGTFGTVRPPDIDDGDDDGDPERVPEPSSILGLLAFGAFSTFWLRKKRSTRVT
ncbi:choice-of-anchor L domain-containing protein [Aerosakkonemataceae cyanobacterium BLCC-F154]|uniref:Choice-of-anchor L domain-containing protein n=1 Tax=Floridaenema fluviatile BLCC-F154 TaxID=3153640 RepID=A0ABV4Y868_9CYAN